MQLSVVHSVCDQDFCKCNQLISLKLHVFGPTNRKNRLTFNADVNVNVNVNLYSASSQEAPLMRSMCRVLIRKTRLQCTTKTVNLHVRLTQIVLEQVPCRWSSIHDPLQLVGNRLWCCGQQQIAIVDPGRNKGVNQYGCRFVVE